MEVRYLAVGEAIFRPVLLTAVEGDDSVDHGYDLFSVPGEPGGEDFFFEAVREEDDAPVKEGSVSAARMQAANPFKR